MASYTTQLRTVGLIYGEEEVKSWFSDYELTDFLTQYEISVINSRGTWDKNRLANKIYNHYFMEEIGFETPALFRQRVKSVMQELMEEYLPLIYSASIDYDPLVNVDYSETYQQQGTSSGTSNSSSTNNGSGLTVNSDTPQGQISKQNILNGSYASSTSANENTNSITDNSSSSSNESNAYTKTVKGNSGVSATAQKMIQQYRDNIRAIDREIIQKLEPLFMGIY